MSHYQLYSDLSSATSHPLSSPGKAEMLNLPLEIFSMNFNLQKLGNYMLPGELLREALSNLKGSEK